MQGPAIANDPNDYLDILGQQPTLNDLYTQICFCFSVADTSAHSSIINTLTNGLERISASFPWLAGEVVNEGSSDGNSGSFKIKPLGKVPRLVVKDLRRDASIPTMDALRQANFPISMLDETIIAPRKTLSGGSEESASDPTPVLLLQANFITGGLLLTVLGLHSTMDMVGQSQVMHLFSKACHNERFTSEELSSGNLDRRNIIPLLDDSYNGPELTHQVVKPTPSYPISNNTKSHPPSPPPQCTWAYFIFHPASLIALKSLATKTITLSSRYISTDDALSAFIWKFVSRARLSRLDSTAESTLARAVDVRRYLDIPQTYPGMVQNMTYHTYTLQKLVEEPLGGVALQLRLALDLRTSMLGYNTRALATLLNRAPDKNIISVTATLDLSVDIMISSWAKIDCYGLDFNLGLGKPETVRRPRFVPVESLIYFMPKTPNGEIAVAICLRDEDMERLRADEEFAMYGRYIG